MQEELLKNLQETDNEMIEIKPPGFAMSMTLSFVAVFSLFVGAFLYLKYLIGMSLPLFLLGLPYALFIGFCVGLFMRYSFTTHKEKLLKV